MNVKRDYVNVGVMSSSDGWKPPRTNEDLQREFFSKHGDDHYTREIDRRWRIMGKLIAHGAAVRIPDGRLAR